MKSSEKPIKRVLDQIILVYNLSVGYSMIQPSSTYLALLDVSKFDIHSAVLLYRSVLLTTDHPYDINTQGQIQG